ncbi:hypothetical protein Poli38472_009473 [Pythium oligandrum]|uniref:Uncharacterized protein n=1 Tax=Pythium oligandrum TaxID=41045 RepID=A0A8K1FFS3_PYTOL|nr:hypothetical protein Poli38472_009473 [Pythium oligandrum]|eukprot:TMW61980.1 hypothetical protein Poli38472_009473 [Pythium oligandrum]
MADIIDKIGKYFAEQEAQLRQIHAHVVREQRAQAPVAVEPAPTASRSRRESVESVQVSVTPEPSLLRRRLSLPEQPEQIQAKAASSTVSVDESEATNQSEELETRSNASQTKSRRRVTSTKKKATTKKKPTKRRAEHEPAVDEVAMAMEKAQRAAEGLARAQERARRLQLERTMQEQQQAQAREASLARIQDQMRKIEEIRRRGKPFALRLRPQSAPTTPSTPLATPSSETLPASGEVIETTPVSLEEPESTIAPRTKSFLGELERQVHDKMMLEMRLNERVRNKKQHNAQEWKRLETQLSKQLTRDAMKEARITVLTSKKQSLETELAKVEQETANTRQERGRVEDAWRKDQLQRQREAEREILKRIQEEESQRLLEDERQRSENAAEARTRAKERVVSRAALLKRLLHGCDVRGKTATTSKETERKRTGNSNNNDEEWSLMKTRELVLPPELAEFEEDGLQDGSTIVDATELHDTTTSTDEWDSSAFVWRVAPLSAREVRDVVWREALSSDSENDT